MQQEEGGSVIEPSKIIERTTVSQTGDYTVIQLKRQNELTRAIQDRVSDPGVSIFLADGVMSAGNRGLKEHRPKRPRLRLPRSADRRKLLGNDPGDPLHAPNDRIRLRGGGLSSYDGPLRLAFHAITDAFTPGQSASGNSQGSPTTSSAARSSSKLPTVRGPNRVATTNSSSAPGR